MAITKEWADNPFWTNGDKTSLRAILIKTDDKDGTKTSEILDLNKLDEEGNVNPDWTSIMEQIGEDGVDESTQKRSEDRKQREKDREEQIQNVKKSKEMEALFATKLKAFEIEEVKNSKNRQLKSRLRKSKNAIEVNVYTMMIIMEEIENENTDTTTEEN